MAGSGYSKQYGQEAAILHHLALLSSSPASAQEAFHQVVESSSFGVLSAS
jgi:hypothetical protein